MKRLVSAGLSLLAFFVLSMCTQLFAQSQDKPQQPELMASLHPRPNLLWQRVSPTPQKPEGPVLYQLLFSTAGTAGTIAKFDTNPRHLTNSDITDNSGIVAIGGSGFMINASTGIVTFVNGQPFPGTGTVSSVSNSDSFLTITSPTTTPVVNLNTANTDARYVLKAGDTMTGGLQSPSLIVRNDVVGGQGATLQLTNGSGGAVASTAIEFRSYTVGSAFPEAKIMATDDGSASNTVQILTKVNGSTNNGLVSRVTINSSGMSVAGAVSATGAVSASGGYTQPGSNETLRIVRGNVNADGSVAAGAGFTVQVLAAGEYIVHITPAFSSTPAVTVSPLTSFPGGIIANAPSLFAEPSGILSSSFFVITRNATTAVGAVDAEPFSFIAIGPP